MTLRNLSVLLVLFAAGCSDSDPYKSSGGGGDYADEGSQDSSNSYYDIDEIQFLDEAASNSDLNAGLTSLSFVTASGEERQVAAIAKNKNLVVVVTRGNTIPICPYCSTQVANMISRYQEFQDRNTEVVAIYPVETGEDGVRLEPFLGDVRDRLSDPDRPIPFPVLLDVELKAVDHLGIRKDLSKPATYIVDSTGQVRYAYVGAHRGDRPGVAAMLAELDVINGRPAQENTTPPADSKTTTDTGLDARSSGQPTEGS